jgi:apolipoprotein N-acyltransferase
MDWIAAEGGERVIPRGKVGAGCSIAVMVACLVVGYFAFMTPTSLWLILLIPFLAGLDGGRWWIARVLWSYYLGGCLHIPGGILGFFGASASLGFTYGAPLIVSLVLASPFLIVAAGRSVIGRSAALSVALTLSVIPPLGLVGILNPLFAAPLLFPGMGWGSVVSFAALFVLWCSWVEGAKLAGWWVLNVGFLAVAGLANVASLSAQAGESDIWLAVDTRDGRNTLPAESAALLLAQRVKKGVEQSDFEFLVFPEATLADFSLTSELILASLQQELLREGRTVFFGVVDHDGAGGWSNGVYALGKNSGFVDQSRVPMPFGNWRLVGGVPVRPFDSDLVKIRSRDGVEVVAFSICYEDNLIWPHRGLLGGKATRLVSFANLWMTGNTELASIQSTGVWSLATMAGVPFTRAVNHPRDPATSK